MNLKWSANVVAWIAVIIVLGGAGVYLVLNKEARPPLIPAPVPGPITVSGEITCLPKMAFGLDRRTLECAIGLKGLDGRHYGLKNLFQYDDSHQLSTVGLRVEVSGIFSSAEMPGPGGVSYDVVGTIDLTSIKEIAVSPAPFPSPKLMGEKISLREGQRESSLLVEKIYPDRVDGLNFGEYPISTEQGFPVTLRIGETASNGCTVTLTLIEINDDSAVFFKKTDLDKPCPICLAGTALVDTPSGLEPVKNIRVGMPIWTIDASGRRVYGIVAKTSKVLVPSTHKMVHLVLDDGREILVSPGHPTIDGRRVGDLVSSDLYDGARVVSAFRVPYSEGATYDLLPSGETGFYWAGGILLKSTLH